MNGTFIIKNKILVHSASLADISLTKMGDFQIPVMGKRQLKFFSQRYIFNSKSDFKVGLFYDKNRFDALKRPFWSVFCFDWQIYTTPQKALSKMKLNLNFQGQSLHFWNPDILGIPNM